MHQLFHLNYRIHTTITHCTPWNTGFLKKNLILRKKTFEIFTQHLVSSFAHVLLVVDRSGHLLSTQGACE
jgi:hypothetical protein